MKLLICDRCECTDKPIGKAELASEADEFKFTDVISREFVTDVMSNYDLCGSCHKEYLRNETKMMKILKEKMGLI